MAQQVKYLPVQAWRSEFIFLASGFKRQQNKGKRNLGMPISYEPITQQVFQGRESIVGLLPVTDLNLVLASVRHSLTGIRQRARECSRTSDILPIIHLHTWSLPAQINAPSPHPHTHTLHTHAVRKRNDKHHQSKCREHREKACDLVYATCFSFFLLSFWI